MLKNWFEKNKKFQKVSKYFSFFSKKILWNFYFLKISFISKNDIICAEAAKVLQYFYFLKKWFNTFKFNFSNFHKLKVQFSTVSTNINISFFFFFARPFENYFVSNINHKRCFFFCFWQMFHNLARKKKKKGVRGTKETKSRPKSPH